MLSLVPWNKIPGSRVCGIQVAWDACATHITWGIWFQLTTVAATHDSSILVPQFMYCCPETKFLQYERLWLNGKCAVLFEVPNSVYSVDLITFGSTSPPWPPTNWRPEDQRKLTCSIFQSNCFFLFVTESFFFFSCCSEYCIPYKILYNVSNVASTFSK